MKNNSGRVKRLTQYTTASAAFLALQQHADAQITYIDIEPDSIISADDTMFIDMNLDSINDVMFWIESQTGFITTSFGASSSYLYRFARVDALNYNVLVGNEGTYSGYVFRSAYQFASGELIGYDNPEYFAGSGLLAAGIFVNGDTIYSAGPWNGADGQFLGMRFKFEGYNHWAWLRLKVGEGGSSVTVYDLAYVNTADIAIPAGVTTAVQHETLENNPAIFSAGATIHIHFTQQFTEANYFIFDLAGKELLHNTLSNPSTEISCNNFPTGMYLVKVSNGKNVFTQKVMVIGQ